MKTEAILSEVAALVPYARTLVSVLETLHVLPAESKSDAILQIIGTTTETAKALIGQIRIIQNQTEHDYPEIWANVRDDWNAAVEAWRALPE